MSLCSISFILLKLKSQWLQEETMESLPPTLLESFMDPRKKGRGRHSEHVFILLDALNQGRARSMRIHVVPTFPQFPQFLSLLLCLCLLCHKRLDFTSNTFFPQHQMCLVLFSLFFPSDSTVSINILIKTTAQTLAV